jgi:hypothetical protein
MPRQSRQPRQARQPREPRRRPVGYWDSGRHAVVVPGGYYDPIQPEYPQMGTGSTEAEAVRNFAGQHQPYRTLSWVTGSEWLKLLDGYGTVVHHTMDAEGNHIVREPGLFG